MSERDYSIVSQMQDRAMGPARALIDVIDVAWAGPNGITGNVVVPVTEFTAERVDQLIRADLATRLQVAQLGTRSQ